MKLGENPQRGQAHDAITPARIFVVVYVPHLTGFFANMKTILDMCFDSLERTIRPGLARVTLVNNASCPEVEELLLKRRSEVFDQINLSKVNRGKIDGLLSSARGALEEIVVVSDCDVMFRPGWLEEVMNVFAVFPEAASVSPISSPRRYAYETRTTLLDAALKRELYVKQRTPAEDFARMTDGSANPEAQLVFVSGQATVTRNGFDAGVAGAHQCVAFRREMLRNLPSRACRALLEPHADRDFLDRPPDVKGYWRLSTPRSYAYHMGNVPRSWMFDVAREKTEHLPEPRPLPPLRKPIVGRLPYVLRRKLAFFVQWSLSRRLGTSDSRSRSQGQAKTFAAS